MHNINNIYFILSQRMWLFLRSVFLPYSQQIKQHTPDSQALFNNAIMLKLQFIRESQEKSPETSINTIEVQRHSAYTVFNLQWFVWLHIDRCYVMCWRKQHD